MTNQNSENGGTPLRVSITIPGNATVGGTSIATLSADAGCPIPNGASLRISGNAPGVAIASRGSFVVASPRPGQTACVDTDFTTHGEAIPSGADFYDPSTKSGQSFVRSTTSSTVSALLVIYP